MKQCLRGVTIVLLAIFGLYSGASQMVFAQSETGSAGITPAYPSKDNPRTESIFIQTIKPGESAQDGVMVINNTKETRTINLGAVDSSASVDGSFSCKQNTEKQTKVAKWISLEKKSVTLAAGTNEVVKFTIQVPAGTSPGEHGGCITAQDTKSYSSTKGSGVLLGFRNAIRLAVTVPGKIVKELSIVRVETKRLPDGNYSVSPVAKNSGNVSLDVQTRAQLVGNFGQKTPIKDDAKYPIMPGATMGWPYVFERPFWGGFYKARVSISYNANPTDGIGENVGSVKKARAETQYFFMVPAPQAIAVELGVPIMLVFGIFTVLRRKHRRKKMLKRWQQYTVVSGDTIMSIASAHGIRWRRLARVNGLKSPYVMSAGQTALVPRPKPLKTSRKKQKAQHEEGWFLDQDGTSDATEQLAESAAPSQLRTTQVPPLVPREQHMRQQTTTVADAPQRADWQPVAPPRPAVQPQPNPVFPEPEDASLLDWRQGASDEELRTLGVIHDSASVPGISSSWNIDDEGPASTPKITKKRPVAKTKKTPTKKRSTKSKKGA